MSKKSVLIIGISSFVGSNLAELLKKDFKVFGTFRKSSINIPEVTCFPCDVLTREDVQMVLFKTRPDVTIYCAGLSSIQDCHEHPDLADALNTSGLFNVSEYCSRYKSQVVVISTGFVFGGEAKDYVEIDIPDANTVYGKGFASSEFYIQKTSLNYLIFRCCTLYGRSHRSDKNHWFEKMQNQMLNNSNMIFDSYMTIGFLDVYFLAVVIRLCIQQGVMNRLFQVSSRDFMTYFDFAKTYCDVFSAPAGLVSKGKWFFPLSLGPGVAAPTEYMNFKLETSNAEGYLNIKLPTVKESLEYTYTRFRGAPKKQGVGGKGEGVKFI